MKRLWESVWAPWLVIGLAVVLRAWKLGEWSLWEDEETTIYFSQNVTKPFPRFFPVFFVTLREWFQLTGLSVAAGRMLAAAVGVAGVGVTYEVCRRLVSRSAGLWAALLLALSLGHVFWSQSIRYFGLLLVFQILSLYWFYQGFERRKPWLLVATNAAFAAALWTHFSAVLLAPVFVGYLLIASWWPRDQQRYRLSEYLAFAVPLALLTVAFAKSLLDAKAFLSGMALPSARNPLHVMMTLAAYCGLP
ncbi:MAG TPA: glycosyltransferase family 39 protein, partial [Gemmataceae bacterium]|nr:glycosyltransferase family 39 protein [Gemmataceae bacterium]